MDRVLEKMKSALPDVIIEENEPLAPFTALKIGGPARYFLRARSLETLKTAVLAARELKLPYFLLGGGCSVLVADKGFDGLVIKVEDRHWETDGELVRAGSGVPLIFLARETAKAGNTGFEFMAAVPGTVAGAIRSNAGTTGKVVADCIVRVRVLDEAGVDRWVAKEACEFDVEKSIFQEKPEWVILEGEFFMEFGSKEQAEARVTEMLQKRAVGQVPGAAARAFSLIKRGDAWVSAADVIKEVGLTGHAIGDAMVANEDPSCIVNTGNATAEQVVELMSVVKTRVRDERGVELRDALDLVGFSAQ
jgi:UDP-N-acetylmuramate dehydrogenase